jgi:hypothetical protein
MTPEVQVMIHEIGLGHAGTGKCSGQPIMCCASARYAVCGQVKPQTDDINGINAIY